MRLGHTSVLKISARAAELTNRLPAETGRLREERQDLLRRLEENDREANRVINDDVAARRVVDDLRAKIESAPANCFANTV